MESPGSSKGINGSSGMSSGTITKGGGPMRNLTYFTSWSTPARYSRKRNVYNPGCIPPTTIESPAGPHVPFGATGAGELCTPI